MNPRQKLLARLSREHHSLEFRFTVQQDLNRFNQTTVFDGETIFYCDDNGLRDEPRQDWVHQTFNTEDLEERQDFCRDQYWEQVTRFEEIMKIITDTAGFVQRCRGCTGNRSEVTSFDKWRLNGDDFLTFNTTTQTWEPDSELAAPVASNWNQNSYWNLVDGEFSQNWCRKILHVFVEKKAAGRKHQETDVLDKETITVWNWMAVIVIVIVIVGLVLVLFCLVACYIRRNKIYQELIRGQHHIRNVEENNHHLLHGSGVRSAVELKGNAVGSWQS
ncbi:uncharacterized protein LOC114797441 isoform X2 [Denticeps clupeoides]|uniref:uncharacterized protein LOC114797441 isoform X2 n=1 Tax=Denticeps clupeoides TaxID=299321 RepID=UPI0010A37155|nr:uncharacterized protein LOC114797441 isoform X2 [Denticeps clupeoides]